MTALWIALGLVLGGALGAFAGYSYRKNAQEKKIGRTEEYARNLLEDAQRRAEDKKKETILEAKEEVLRLKTELDREVRERRVQQREESLDKKMDSLEAREESLNRKQEDLQRLTYAALEQACAVALFGHTHEPFLAREQGVLLLNPGSLCQPRLGAGAGLALLTVEKGEAKGVLLPYALRR